MRNEVAVEMCSLASRMWSAVLGGKEGLTERFRRVLMTKKNRPDTNERYLGTEYTAG